MSSKRFVYDSLLRLFVVLLVALGMTSKDYSLAFFLISGLLLGTYYGIFNDVIWRPSGKLHDSVPYRSHHVWIHIIGSSVGSISLYLFSSSINFFEPQLTVRQLGLTEFVLFSISILGYVGLLPRLIWYLSYGQKGFFK